MNRTILLRLFALVVAIAAVAGVVALAYHFGVTNSVTAGPLGGQGGPGGPVGRGVRGMPMRGHMGGYGYEPGLGLLWIGGLVVVGLLFVWLLAALVSPNRGGSISAGPATGDIERLRELSAMHDAGKLTDDEFAAAKRKLLGLQ